MLEIKTFEIRDKATFVPALAMQIVGADWLMRAAGWHSQYGCILLIHLQTKQARWESHEWGDRRTMTAAHRFIEDNWSTLKSGDLIDVRVVLGEAAQPCETERRHYEL